jgi:hypothetical protein
MRSHPGRFWLSDRRRALLPWMAIGLLASGEARAQFSLFDWTYNSPSGTGHGQVLGDTMYILGPDSTSCNGSTNSFTAVAPYAMTLVAAFDASNFDEFGVGYDFIVTTVDGVETVISHDAECGGCEAILEVPAGSVFGFGVQSADCQLGPAEVTLTNLRVEPAGGVVVVSGAEAGALFGSALAGVSDVDGDGAPDVLVGAPLANASGIESGRVTVHSGQTGAELRSQVWLQEITSEPRSVPATSTPMDWTTMSWARRSRRTPAPWEPSRSTRALTRASCGCGRARARETSSARRSPWPETSTSTASTMCWSVHR